MIRNNHARIIGVFSLTIVLSGCADVRRAILDLFRSRTVLSPHVASLPTVAPSMLPPGTYKITGIFCNGSPPTGVLAGLSETFDTMKVENATLTMNMKFGNCSASVPHSMELADTHLKIIQDGVIQCSNAEDCNAFISRNYDVKCNEPGLRRPVLYEVRKPSEDAWLLSTGDTEKICSKTKSGADPMAIQLKRSM